jgi:adenosine deaminase
MARDFDIMKKNIIKLVKLNGGKPTSRAESFFMTQKQREEALEAKFGKKSPTKVEMKAQEKRKYIIKTIWLVISWFQRRFSWCVKWFINNPTQRWVISWSFGGYR